MDMRVLRSPVVANTSLRACCLSPSAVCHTGSFDVWFGPFGSLLVARVVPEMIAAVAWAHAHCSFHIVLHHIALCIAVRIAPC
eukprot:12824861-Alexandrium_andersonii.AAC.1